MQTEGELVLTWASYRRRIFGFMIDVGLLMASMIVIILALNVTGIDFSKLFFLLPLGLLLRDAFTNRSIGKRILGLYIVKSEDGAAPSKGSLVLRNVLLILGPIELLCSAVQKEGRRFGDLAAKTIVVSYEERPRKLRNTKKRLLLLTSGILVFFVITFGGTMLLLSSSGAFDAAKQASKLDADIRERVGEVTGFGFFPTGGIEISNGEGKASLRFRVKGTKGSVHVNSSLHKGNDGNWEVDVLRISD
ncbi:RDD family protein [Paenibacillus silvisoli]|uniref:RDD family protein n=1 Tax=Paenibacillus silvisoli TaxID=3110539 RepID=UPI00280653CB|nr:RDD family protein [Paenibacillus silvisoli]